MSRSMQLLLRSFRRAPLSVRPAPAIWRPYSVDAQSTPPQQQQEQQQQPSKPQERPTEANPPSESTSAAQGETAPSGEKPLIRRLPTDPNRLRTRNGVIVEQKDTGATVRLPFIPGVRSQDRTKYLDYVQLRDSCGCRQCVDPHSKQRNFHIADIPADIRPANMRWVHVKNGQSLRVKWASDVPGFDDSHISYFHARQLVGPGSPTRKGLPVARHRKLWDREIMEKNQYWISYEDYMNDDSQFAKAMRALSLYGLLFVKDIPDSREMVEKIATRMGPLRNSFYGNTWDVRSVPEAKNVAYTNKDLGFHMDLLYMTNPPGFQLLHCLRNSAEGGESLFSDSFRAVRKLNRKDFGVLSMTELPYHYIQPDHRYYNTWRVIETERKFNRSVIKHVNYSPPFQAPLPRFGSSTLGWPRKVRDLHAALNNFRAELENESNVFRLKLKPGECVIFENRRVVHSRTAFDTSSGERWLAGTYVDEQDVMSKFMVLKEKFPKEWQEVTRKTTGLSSEGQSGTAEAQASEQKQA
ncbi:hypothetical protein VTN31DRAFT_4307 [Thermomyces dupontii]|uniref:uncharacterized protein n=1 Tax=Talaromyces thermophilus TaxID=28565 RepID=UPI003743CE37